MTNVKDLEIEKEILPLFDFTNHPFAGETLLQLLIDRPMSVEEIVTRQDIIKGFIANWNNIRSFSYSKADLHEVYGFLTTVIREESIAGLYLFINKRRKQQLKAGIIQSLQLFQKLQGYLALLRMDAFPAAFSQRIANLQQFMAAFNTTRITEVMQIIRQKAAAQEISVFWEDLFLFEAYFSLTKAHLKYQFCFPAFTTGNFELTGFYHPLLKTPVKNDVTIQGNVLLLTGANMAGKSTLLKAIGLCVYLGHLGIGVPANTCHMPFFPVISIAINLKDDLKSGYSHFLSEIKTLKNVATEAAGRTRCFAVFDELFRGTNLEDALEISKTTINGLTKFPDSVFLVSTHLHQLKELVDHTAISTHYIECHIKNSQPVFTYMLKTGWSTIKIGQLLFEQEGLNRLLNA